ncbi:MAG: hypothetical protein ABR540_18965 [Acidimicrobiales bacterium]
MKRAIAALAAATVLVVVVPSEALTSPIRPGGCRPPSDCDSGLGPGAGAGGGAGGGGGASWGPGPVSGRS